jgi:hypothetical protein
LEKLKTYTVKMTSFTSKLLVLCSLMLSMTALLVAAALMTGCASDKSQPTAATGTMQKAASKDLKPARTGVTGKKEAMHIPMPASGKAKVVFFRADKSGLGGRINFRIHDGDQLIGVLIRDSYFVYECEPGDHFFSSSMENVAMLDANLLPDRIYYAKASAAPGCWVARVKMSSLHPGGAGDLWPQLPKLLPRLRETTLFPEVVEHERQGTTRYMERVQKWRQEDYLSNTNREQILPEHGQTKPIGAP